MCRILKMPLSFILGLLVGFMPTILIAIGMYRFHKKTEIAYKETGMPHILSGPRKFGNIEIIAADNVLKTNPTNEVMGVDGILSIQKDGKVLISMLFNENKYVTSISLNNDEEDAIVSVNMYREGMAYLDYGNLKKGSNWYDLDCDGVFDLQFREFGKTKDIFLNNEWIRVSEKSAFEKAFIVNDEVETPYIFDFQRGKWMPGNSDKADRH